MQPGPGRSAKPPVRFVLIVSVVAIAALGSSIFFFRAHRPEREARKRAGAAAAAAAARNAAVADRLAQLRAEPDPMAFVQARAGKDDAATMTELVQAYAAWASRGEALEARKQIVKRFVEDSNLKVGLAALLEAVALDATPRQADPLWHGLVRDVSGLWNAGTVAWGRDLLQTENSPRARDLLLEGLANASPDQLGGEQKDLLVTDLIDMYPYASPDQKPALDKALATMAGPDVVEILAHRGINEGSAPLASIQAINQEIEANRTKYRKVLEQIEEEDRQAQETNAREAAKSKP